MERKTIDDALMAIKCCNGVDGLNCDSCPYLYDTEPFCKVTKNAKAIDAIERLIAENAAMLDTLKRMAHSGGGRGPERQRRPPSQEPGRGGITSDFK